MGFDPYGVVWNTRVGASGDAAYNVRGATQLDDTLDTGAQSPVHGPSDIYSTIPTPTEINNGWSFNQVVAVCRRRILNNAHVTGSYPSAPNYATTQRIGHGVYTSLCNTINDIRAAEKFSAYTFPTVAAGDLMLGKHLAHLRKALRISGTCAFAGDHAAAYYHRRGNPFGTKYDASVAADWSLYLGHTGASGGYYHRYRWAANVPLPDWADTVADSGTASIVSGTASVGTWTLRYGFWVNTKTSFTVADFEAAPSVDWYYLTGAMYSLTKTLALLDPSYLSPYAGGYISVLLATDGDLSDDSSVNYLGELGVEGVTFALDFGS